MILRWAPHCLVWIFGVVCVFATTAYAIDYMYLDCYKDVEKDADLNGRQITLDSTNFDFDQCATECQKMGYPYFGIQEKKKCLCGHTYSKHGRTNTCNYTCNSNIQCGGFGSNDIFYSVKVDSTSESIREDEVYADGKSFTDARTVCVQYQGDILPIMTAGQWTAIKSVLDAEGITSGKIWQGMRKKFDNDVSYAYTDPSKPPFGGSSYSNWVATETMTNPCVVINVADGTWESSSCSAQYPYICHQQPPPDVLPTEADDGSGDGDGEDTGNFDMSKLSLYIVLPLFGFCYGGSCILYCSHKIYKALKRKKRQKMMLTRLEDMPDGHSPQMIEYEPHNKPVVIGPPPPNNMQPYGKMNMAHMNKMNEANKGGGKMPPPMGMGPPPPSNVPRYEPHPKPQHVRPFSASRRAVVHPFMGPAPMTNNLFKEPSPPPKEPERPVRTPVEEIKISPRGEPEGEQAKEEPESQNPQTARDVEIDMPPESLPPPVVSADAVATAAVAVEAMKPSPRRDGSQSAKTKAEMRRQKLLNKAVKEARERRRKEAESAASTPAPPESTSPDETQWAQPSKKRNKSPKYGDDPDSGDSTVNLLSDSERGQSLDPNQMGRDPTTMSIQEILRMKVAAKQNRKRPKKPISG